MKENYPDNMSNNDHSMDQGKIFEMVEPPYGKSKEEVWGILDRKISEKTGAKVVTWRRYRILSVAAAVLFFLAGTLLVMRYYARTVITDAGEMTACNLPDGSRVQMNAVSSIKYYPLWWKIDRIVRLDGEGFFEVEKGSRFSVISDRGTTSVLGTSFNVYSRDDGYKVTCFTGSVKVVSGAKQEAVLTPDYNAVIDGSGNIIMSREAQPEKINSWISGMFSFASEPLSRVLDEIERQYNVSIVFNDGSDYIYSGYFSREKPVEEVLQLVCKPFGLKFARKADRSFEIY